MCWWNRMVTCALWVHHLEHCQRWSVQNCPKCISMEDYGLASEYLTGLKRFYLHQMRWCANKTSLHLFHPSNSLLAIRSYLPTHREGLGERSAEILQKSSRKAFNCLCNCTMHRTVDHDQCSIYSYFFVSIVIKGCDVCFLMWNEGVFHNNMFLSCILCIRIS